MTKEDFWSLVKRSKPIGLILAVLFVIAIVIASVADVVSDGQYNRKMSKLDRTAPPKAGADKIVLYIEEDSCYTERYIPEELLAKGPAEVAAVIICDNGTVLDGIYPNGATGYIRTVTVSWYDLKTQSVLAEEIFYGSGAPNSIKSSDRGDQYGSAPNADKITEWISGMAQSYLP